MLEGTELAAEQFGPVDVAGNTLLAIVSSAAQQACYLRDISAARKRVWLETYTLVADGFGEQVAAALKERAAAGLDVRLIVDAIGSLGLSDSFIEDLKAAGVRCHVFRPLSKGLSRWRVAKWMNRRDHRKLLIVDDEIAYFGGMNVVDTAIPNPPHGWRDVHVRVRGPFSADLAAAFLRLWEKVAESHRVQWPKWPPLPERASATESPDVLCVYDSIPSIRYRRPERVLVPLLKSARERVLIVVAYFLPTPSLMRAIWGLRKKGTTVEVIVPAHSDVPLVKWATTHIYDVLVKKGVRLYERRERMLHSKVLVVDDERSVVGSCNLDARSLIHNLEIVVVVRSRPFAAIIRQIIEQERADSILILPEHCSNHSWWCRLRHWMAWQLRKWL